MLPGTLMINASAGLHLPLRDCGIPAVSEKIPQFSEKGAGFIRSEFGNHHISNIAEIRVKPWSTFFLKGNVIRYFDFLSCFHNSELLFLYFKIISMFFSWLGFYSFRFIYRVEKCIGLQILKIWYLLNNVPFVDFWWNKTHLCSVVIYHFLLNN